MDNPNPTTWREVKATYATWADFKAAIAAKPADPDEGGSTDTED